MTTDASIKHLKAPTARWYQSVLAEFALEEHHRRILLCACESWDRCEAARLALKKHGMVYADRWDAPRCRPEVAIERDARLAFIRCVRELGLDVSEPGESRPPTIPGNNSRRFGR